MSYPVFQVPAGDVLPIFFSSYAGATGASITCTGLAVTDIEIYKDGGVTQRASDAGYTLLDTDGIDFDAITGIHGFSIDTGDNTDAGFYTTGAWFTVVVSAITVDSQTVSFVAAQFRIMAAETAAAVPKVDVSHWLGTAASTPTVAGVPNVNVKTWNDLTTVALPLVPTTAGRTLDVSATGEAGLDWANIGSPTTAQNLSGTNIDVDQVVASVSGTVATVTTLTNLPTIPANWLTAAGTAADFTTEIQSGLATAANLATALTDIDDIQTRLPAALVGGRMDASVGAIAANAITAAATAADFGAEIADVVWDEALAGHAVAGSAGAALSASGAAADPWATALPGAYGAGTAGKIVGDNINATISSRAAASDLATVAGYLDTEIAAIKSVTDALPDAGALTSLPATILTTAMTESYRANGAAPTLAQAMCETLAHLGEASIAGTTKTIKKLDHTTTAETFTLNSATEPTSVTRAT